MAGYNRNPTDSSPIRVYCDALTKKPRLLLEHTALAWGRTRDVWSLVLGERIKGMDIKVSWVVGV